MELRPGASQKENVSPRPATPLRPEQRRLPKSLGVVLGSGQGPWVPRGQAESGEPATTPSPRAALRQEPCQVQTNLASPRPRLGLALKDTTGRLINSRFQQQSNLQPLGVFPLRGARAFSVQQSNLRAREAGLAGCGSRSSPHPWSEPQEGFWPHGVPRGSPQPPGPQAQPSPTLKPSWLLATDTPCPCSRPTLRYAPTDGHTQPGPRSWGGLGDWPSRLMGEPLTLDDLAVPVKSPARAPPQAATSRLLASGQHLEQEAARLRCWGAQEPPGPSPQEPWTSGGQALPAGPQCTEPVLTFCGQRKKHPRGLRGAVSLPETPGVQASSKSASPPQTALEVLTGGFPDPVQGVLPAYPLRRGKRPACSRGQTGGPLLPQENKAGNLVNLESERARRQLLSSCFRAWQHLVRRRQAAALGHRRQLCRGLRLREAHMEVACGGQKRALLAQSFQKWRHRAQQQKQGQPHFQAGPGPPPSGGGQPPGPSGRKPGVDPAQRSSPGSLREEAGARPMPSRSGLRPDGGDGRVQILQALQRLAVFLLRCQQEEWARQEKGVQGEASGATLRTQSMGRRPQAWCSPAADTAWVPPLAPQHQRAWLRRCFGAWRRLVKSGAQPREHLADRQMGTPRMCLKHWVWMKLLRASDGAKVTQLSLCRQKEGMWPLLPESACGNMDLGSSAPGGLRWVAQVQGLPQERGQGSPQKACSRRALHGVLLLWRARLSQSQRADSFSQGVQRRLLRRILRAWRLRVWGPGNPSGSARTTSASELRGSTAPSPQEKASRASALLETLRLSFLWAAGRQQQARCLLLWQARAQQSWRAARWHQHTLQRRILLGWSHWSMAQGAQRKLAARWAWDRSCRDALGLWRRRLAQWQEAEQWAQERGRRRVRDALQHWHSSWQRQQCLHDRYQGWVQLRRQGLRRAVFQSWRQAAAHQRHRMARPERLALQSHFQAWCGSARDAGTLRARCRAVQAGLRRRALGATLATWQEARVAAARARECHVAQASIALWRSHVQRGRADRQLRRARAQQAFMAWRVALGQRCEARQQAEGRARARTQLALCWTLWVQESRLHRLSRARAARTLSARVLEAWAQSAAQGRVQRVAIAQFEVVGDRQLLRAHWAQWRTELLSVWLEPRMEAQETSTAHPRPRTDLTHWPGLAGRGRLLALMDTAAPWKQTRSCRPQGTGPRPPSPAQHRSPGGQRKRRETSWAQSDSAAQLWMQRPGSRAQGRPPPGPGGDCSSEGQVDKRRLGRKYLRYWHLEALLRRLQGSQQARRLAGTWQCWVDAQGAEELARSLVSAQAVAAEMGLAHVAAAGRAAAGGSAITATSGGLGPFSGTGGAAPAPSRPFKSQRL
ncbi:uncharacterized protein C1orf167 homolog [Myotis daubentonii]|uniref:uncharacterized protein C1orf167 homolog n=1 Tax=Myotis daubentonii TaxID=98922 RepID=UPI002873DCE4|nr:uncharacterized protein C1orf167 homolog [Myotis daubentonii]